MHDYLMSYLSTSLRSTKFPFDSLYLLHSNNKAKEVRITLFGAIRYSLSEG